ncbi:hypothetical protein [Clostridium lacusfryxellense]|uniref:hypothetical protein n=1 Tax=Clostridium lacusfryxellense TaxID=205328 RepID=UPI001C0BFCA4|nr:hypothetical protein [Clostridium lacusfryxellense]MBU3110850.1 hypothetical protein [Clostridium lacusfryxellense]
MNNLIDTIISYFKDISKNALLYITTFYNKTTFLIDNNFALNKIYKPIIEEKVTINKKLQETIKLSDLKNRELENNIIRLGHENELLQTKISIIEDLITKDTTNYHI